MEPESSLTCSNKSAISPYPERNKSMNPVHIFPQYFPRSTLILSSHLRLGLPRGILPSASPTKVLHAFLISPMRALCPVNLILPDLVTLIIFDEQHKIWISPLCSVLQPPRSSPNYVQIFFSAPCFQTPSINVLSYVWDQVSHPYKRTGKIKLFLYFNL